jgi:hypothetical protein
VDAGVRLYKYVLHAKIIGKSGHFKKIMSTFVGYIYDVETY